MRVLLGTITLLIGIQLCIPIEVSARDPRRPQHLVGGSAGLGLSKPTKGTSPDGRGFYGSGEYAYDLSAWFQPRAYAGLLLTFPDSTYCGDEPVDDCEATAKIGFLGVKGRVAIPIPYVAPFIELGIGASLGVIKTRTATTNEATTGAAVHVPFAIGLALGEDHDFDVMFRYLFHPAEKQVNGGITFGIMFVVD